MQSALRWMLLGRNMTYSPYDLPCAMPSLSWLLLRLDAKHRPEGVIGSDVTGLRGATSGSLTDRLSREYRMTLDEARLILNVRKEDPIEKILQVRPVPDPLFDRLP